MINLSAETEALAKRLAEAQHLSVDETIRLALEEKARATGIELEPRWPKDVSSEAIAKRRASIDRFVTEIAAMPVLDARSPQEIMDDLNAL
jgi:antitoxin VapB